MDQQFFDDIKNYSQTIDVPKAIGEIVNKINDDFKNANFVYKGLFDKIGYGAMIGNIIDSYIPEYFTKYSKLRFKKGNDTKDEDCVCETNAFYNTEVKTTCQKLQKIVGAKTNAGNGHSDCARKYVENKYHFYIFVAFNKPKTITEKLKIANIWIGKLQPSDWSISKSNRSGGAWVKKDIFDKQFINVKNLY